LSAPRADAVEVRWRFACGDAPEPARFADGALVFNPLTWETHLLNPAAMLILDALRTAPRDAGALADALAAEADLDAAERAAYAAQVASTLAEMEVLGLVRRDDARRDPPR
jgi:PqqD family protein of HPr-rel-A system